MNYSNTVIRDGLNGSGQKVYAVQATKHLPGRDLQVHEVFASKAEAEAWINHAMPNNDYQHEPRPEEIDERLAADVTHSASVIGTYRSRFN